MKRELELYIHIPFCVRKCAYCDFLSFPAGKEQQEAYVESLKKEIREWKDRGDRIVSSVFIGGGTPSILCGEQILDIMEEVRDGYLLADDAEITLEANPGTLNARKLKCYREAGINRLSLGLQSACNEELRCLGRIHTWEEFLDSFYQAREAGFGNINVDLMSALPGQTLKSWEDTLEKTVRLCPEHVSAYSLIIEEDTPFYARYGEDAKRREAGGECRYLPGEELERKMYEQTELILSDAGYHHYEISNYAQPGKECRHNCGYWTRKEYRGFGLGAASLIRDTRFSNVRDLNGYLKHPGTRLEEQILTREEQMEETMYLGLRLMTGVQKKTFLENFGCSMEQVYGTVLSRMIEQGLMGENKEKVWLTRRGTDLGNYVFAHFLLD